MKSNIVSLVDNKKKPNQGIIDVCKALLQDAESGKMKYLVAVSLHYDSVIDRNIKGECTQNEAHTMIGGLMYMQDNLLRQIITAEEAEEEEESKK